MRTIVFLLVVSIAGLTSAMAEEAGAVEAQLRDALRALVPFTRQEAGCLDYTLFELADKPGTFYMRESFRDQAALDAHFRMPYFKAFEKRFDELLSQS